jgi:hypothetical protein
MKESSPESKTLWHRLLGTLLQELLTPVGISVYTDFQIMSEPPLVDILLLRREQPEWTKEQRALLPDGVRDSRASHILLEFKYTESVNEAAFRQALGYDAFYRRAQKLPSVKIQTFILSAKTPAKATLSSFGYAPTEQPGVYRSENILLKAIPLLVLNELQDEPHNAFIKYFASRRKAKRAAYQILQRIGFERLSTKLYWLIAGLGRNWFAALKGEVMTEEVLTVDDFIEMGRELHEYYLSTLTPAELLKHVKPEDVLSLYKPEEILTRLKPEEVFAQYEPEERMAGLSIEEIEAYLHKLKVELNNQLKGE